MKRSSEMTANTLDSEADMAGNDLSVLRQPIKTSVTGFNEARKAYEDGTKEVKRLLSNECDIIYECKVCRNMFRSLVNYISHKRIYCKGCFNSSVHFGFGKDGSFNQDISTIVQAESEYIKAANGKNQDKDLGSIIERLVKRERANRMMKLSDFYEQVNSKLTQDEIIKRKHVLQLDEVPDSSVAVYQTIKTINDGNIKTEVTEMHDLLMNDRNVLGPDGKIVSLADLPFFENGEGLSLKYECDICNSKFATEKTLKLHIEAKHIPSTYVFQCPSCSQTFLKASAVIRHLTNDHKKSMRRIRLMRDSIFKRRTRIDEVQVKGPSRELTRLQTDKERADAQNKAWLDNLENPESGSICTYCGKKFERRAVLISHTKVCQNKAKTNCIMLTRKAIDGECTTLKDNAASNWSRDFDESSNSNSLDNYLLADENIKTELDVDPADFAVVNKRKRKRAAKAVLADDQIVFDEEKSLNIVWNMDANENDGDDRMQQGSSPIAELDSPDNASTTTTWNIIDPDTRMNICTIEETPVEIKPTRDDGKRNGNKSSDGSLKGSKAHSNCKYCDKTFSNASNLRRHISMLHLRQRRFGCVLCEDYRASRKVDVLHHLSTEHEFLGEKSEAMPFICIKEEIIPKVPGSNRRKDKHTEVLKDDTEELIAIITTEVTPSRDVSNENSNADLDMDNNSNSSFSVMANDSTNAQSESATESTTAVVPVVRRKGRPKGSFKDGPKKVERSQSLGEPKIAATKRPVRNRIMPVKKDFVYDLTNLLKKESNVYKEHQQLQQLTPVSTPSSSPPPTSGKPAKRRNTLQGPSENISPDQTKDEEPTEEKPIAETIKGSADAMALAAVNSNRAIFYKPPELPTERLTSTTIKAATHRTFDSAMKDWPILKRPSQLMGSLKSSKINKAHPGINIKRKRKTALLKGKAGKTSSASNYLHKLKSSENIMQKINGRSKAASTAKRQHNSKSHGQLKASEKTLQEETVEEIISSIEENDVVGSDSDSKGAGAQSTPTTPSRRMTLLERIAENKTKKLNETMARMSIGKSGLAPP